MILIGALSIFRPQANQLTERNSTVPFKKEIEESRRRTNLPWRRLVIERLSRMILQNSKNAKKAAKPDDASKSKDTKKNGKPVPLW